jgi:hypothetical protein
VNPIEIDSWKDEYPGIEDLEGFGEFCTHDLHNVPDATDLYSCLNCETVIEIKVSTATQQAWDINFMEPDEMAGWLRGSQPKVCP